ncbi:AraC family transcriptional regulator [Cystobacter fuscus]|uniref:AraC family transcriptional regulator n=1 Tax=Cystobacter fuscus TaxID=43 RepID=A0A250J741_9BACT|nr:AraC family transcriptional regulator [Cystobacter fuscus]ATB39744.1 AraC family transcriptional regulator [Cystobacter fuscus]
MTPPELAGSVHAGAVRHLVEGAERAGLDVRPLLAGLDIPEAALTDLDGRVPLERYVALWKAASAHATSAPLGLVVGREHRPEYGGVLMYLLGHSATLEDGLTRVRRHQRLAHELFIPERVRDGDVVHFQRELPPAIAEVGALAEMLVMMWLTTARQLTGRDGWPREIEFQHACAFEPSVYSEAFHCPVRFERPRTRVSADPSVLDIPLRHADALLCAHLERHAAALLERVPGEEPLAHRVRGLLREELRGGDPSQERIARGLALGTRTLQRRLKDEGVAFNDLLDELRRELCLMHLKDQSLSVQQVAFLLGYAEPSGFYRAFRRWTGTTPQELRARQHSLRFTAGESRHASV